MPPRGAGRPARGMVHRSAHLLAYTFGFFLLLGGVAFAVAYVRLLNSPIQLGELVPPIETGINSQLVGHRVDIGGAELRLGQSGGFEFRLRDLSVFEVDGTLVARAPQAAVALSGRALLSGRVVPARVELIEPTVQLVYTDAGGLAVNRSLAETPDAVEQQTGAPQLEPFSIIDSLSETSRRARERVGATSYLKEFAVSDANVLLDYEGQRSIWKIPEASLDLDHSSRRSLMVGQAKVASVHGPWAISFVTRENAQTKNINIKLTVRGLTPAALGAAAPPFALMRMLEAPVSGDATFEVTADGRVARTDVALEVGAGRLVHSELREAFGFAGGLFKLAYDGGTRRWQLDPSPVRWDGGELILSGSAHDVAKDGEPANWRVALTSSGGKMMAPEFGVGEVAVETWAMTANVVPRQGRVEVESFKIAGGGGSLDMRLVIDATDRQTSSFAELRTSAMPLATFKALWPTAIAPGARSWVGTNILEGQVGAGAAQLLTGTYVPSALRAANPEREVVVSAQLEVDNVAFLPMNGMLPVRTPKAIISLQENVLDVNIADGLMALEDGRTIPLRDGRVQSTDVLLDRPAGRIAFKTSSDLAAFLEAVERLPLPMVAAARPLPKAAKGKIDADLQIDLPLVDNVPAHEVAVLGKAKVSDGEFGQVGGQFDVQGFSLDLDLTEERLGAKGDLLVNGVAAKIVGERVFAVEDDDQPPVRITARLDSADRRQLGLELDDMLQGAIDVDISYDKGGQGTIPAILLSADLTAAELKLPALAWRKPAGSKARLTTNIVTSPEQGTELKAFKIAGDVIAVEGNIVLDGEQRVTSFAFPQATLDVVTRLDVRGTRNSAGLWSIKVRGPRFDGRNLFRSFFSIKDGMTPAEKQDTAKNGDVDIEIGTVLGSADVSVREVSGNFSLRQGKLTAIDLKGRQTSGSFVAIGMVQGTGPRRLRIESQNAGELMRLVDFYPNMQGGALKLEINLDGRGDAEKIGVLWIERFQVLGDPVVSEVVSSVDAGRPAISSGRRRVTREIFQFDRMNAPFSLGHGQVVLNDAYVKGPLVGANLRGRADFVARRVDLGGTYIPLQGLNSALGGIPVLGQLISGTKGEGIFGITFAVQGAMSNPQVIVNPLSLVAPGIFREIFQMTPYNPQIRAREARPSFNEPAARPSGSGQSLDGWSSTTTQQP